MSTTEIYKRYSEAFKHQVVAEYKQGSAATVAGCASRSTCQTRRM